MGTHPLGAAGSFTAISGPVISVGTDGAEVTVGVAVSAPTTSVVDPMEGVGAGVSVSSSSATGGRVGADTGGSVVVVTATTGGEVVGGAGIDMDMSAPGIDMFTGDEVDGAIVSFSPFGGSVPLGGSVPFGGSVVAIDMLRGSVGAAVSFGFFVSRTVGE